MKLENKLGMYLLISIFLLWAGILGFFVAKGFWVLIPTILFVSGILLFKKHFI